MTLKNVKKWVTGFHQVAKSGQTPEEATPEGEGKGARISS